MAANILQNFAKRPKNPFFVFIRQVYSSGRRQYAYKSHSKVEEKNEAAKLAQILLAWTRLRSKTWYFIFPAPPLLAFSLFRAAPKSESKKELSDEELAIIESDRLFEINEIDALYELLSRYRESKNAEILWRLARAARNKAELCKGYEDKKEFTYEALDFAKQSVELDDNNFACHKWYGITLSNAGDFEGTKVKIQNAYKIRDEFKRAIELNSTDPTCRYLLGLWCFTFADMPWYQHKIAAAIFSTPPSSTYQEALNHFEMAEALEADFFSKNHLMIGKTNLRLKNKEEAKLWLKKAASCKCKTVDDQQAKSEAEELLKTI